MKAGVLFFMVLFYSTCIHAQSKPENKFTLPEIKHLKYLTVPTALAIIFPPNSCDENLGKILRTYYVRLADIKGYEVYLVKQNCDFSQNTCLCLETTAQGKFEFLILFNKKLKEAYVLVSAFNFLSDSEVYDMQLKVKGNVITLVESGFTEGENSAEQFSKSTHKISILKSYHIRIESVL